MFGLALDKITLAIQGNLAYADEWPEFSGVCIDTKKIKKGDLFIALKNEEKCERKLLAEARLQGAGGAIVSSRPIDFPFTDFPLIIVENPLKALQQLAIAQRSLFKGPVVALTGSKGKTATRELLAAFLRPQGSVLCTQGTCQLEVSLPLTMLALTKEHQAVIVELERQELGEIDFFCRLCQPTYGVITQLGEGSQDLLAHLPAKGGLALNNADKRALRPWLSNVRSPLIWFGLTGGADIFAYKLPLRGEQDSYFRLSYQDRMVMELKIPVMEEKNISHYLAAIALSKHLGLSWQEMQTIINELFWLR